jgi:serine protease Do
MPRKGLFDRRNHRTALIALGLGFSLLAGSWASRAALAQSAIQAAVERRGPVSPEKRAKLYELLRSQAEILEAQAAVVKTVAKLIGPTVVHVEADVTPRAALQYGRGYQVEEAGSGVVIRLGNDHFVLTNRHVISGATNDKIDINLADGRLIHPKKVWHDAKTDVAVIAVDAPDLVAAPVGDSDTMEIGDFVLAVGSPFGLSYSATYGMISAKRRRGLKLGKSDVPLQSFIQTDTAINPGNSGGPLVNLRGEVIAINTAIASNSGGSEGIGFAIPINMFMNVARQLIEHGEVGRAYLGVTLDRDFGPNDAARLGLPLSLGAKISEVKPNSPAAAAKLLKGDIILQVGNVLIEDDGHLVDSIHLIEVGTEVSLVVFRDRRQLQVSVTVGKWEDSSN